MEQIPGKEKPIHQDAVIPFLLLGFFPISIQSFPSHSFYTLKKKKTRTTKCCLISYNSSFVFHFIFFYHDFKTELHDSANPNMVSCMALSAMQVVGPFDGPTTQSKFCTTHSYLQAERWILGLWTNTIEKGTTVIGSDASTFMGSKGGISSVEFTAKTLPFSSIVWLCRSPFIAVKWYSSLVIAIVFLALCIRSDFLLGCHLGCHRRFETLLMTESVVTWTWAVVLLSRLINNSVIPCCKNAKQHVIT